jgi:hypothetical protein
VLSFAPNFLPEYALAFSKDKAALYDLSVPVLTPTQVKTVTASGSDYTFTASLSSLGLSGKVLSEFNFAANYLAGPSLLPKALPQEVGAYRTNQSVGFSISGADPGSGLPDRTPAPPITLVPSFSTYTQQLANFVGGKSQNPAASDFKTSTASLLPSATDPLAWDYGSTKPLDGLVAAATLTDKRNFMPLAFLTDVEGSAAKLWLPTIPPQ